MLIFRRIAAIILVVIAALGFNFSASQLSADGAKATTERDYCFDDDRLLIGGYNFDMSHADEAHVGYVKEAGIDFLITGVNEDFLNLCDEKGIGVIAAGYNVPSLYYEGDTSSWYTISPDTYKDHACLWGDDLIDEPVASMFPELGRVTDYYYAHTEGKLPYINLFPNYANEEQLGTTNNNIIFSKLLDPFIMNENYVLSMNKKEFSLFGSLAEKFAKTRDYVDPSTARYVDHVEQYINNIDVDYISVDYYPLNNNDETTAIWLRNLDILAQACKKTGKKLWVITQAAGLQEGPRYCDTPEDIRWQVYTSLAFGTRAIIHACYDSGWWDRDSHMINANGERTDTYYAVQKVNAEIAPFAGIYADYDYIGTFLENPYLAAGTSSGYLTPMDEDAGCEIKSESPILVGCFKGEQGRAFSIVNMHETGNDESAHFVAEFDGATEITYYRKGISHTVSGDTLGLTLENEEGIYVTVRY